MLIFVRREGESILIGDAVVVTLLASSARQSRIALYVSRDMTITRCTANDQLCDIPDTRTSDVTPLVLTLRQDEAVLIGDDVELMLCQPKRDKARIGVDAPEHVAIDRAELRAGKERSKTIAWRNARPENASASVAQ